MCDIHIEEYDGPERRMMTTEMYTTVCKERFEGQNEEISKIREDTEYLRRKIDNGLSELPGKVNWLLGILATLLLGITAGVGVWTHKLGQLEAVVEMHFEKSVEVNNGN